MKTGTRFPTTGVLRLSASAGSGKTYSLTQLYLQKALKSPRAFRSMVAITFTNKAANELKERIIKRLHELTDSFEAEKAFTEYGFESAKGLAESAQKVLQQIVHDFDAFRVMTIDSFFQLLFTQLAFDAGLPAGLLVEIDQNRVKNEVLEEGLKSMDENIQTILLENILGRLAEKGKGWRPVKYLQDNLMASLFQSEVLDFQYSNRGGLLKDDSIVEARKVFERYLMEENQVITVAGKNLWEACNTLNINTTRFDKLNYKEFYAELESIRQLAIGKGNRSTRKATYEKSKFWRPAKELSQSDRDSLGGFILELYQSLDPNRVGNIALAESILQNLTAIRLLVFFRSVLSRLNENSNRVLLQEVKYILRGIIDDFDVPYIYEKLGNQISTLLIDEFQDTDQVQWKVLTPLAKAIVDQGGFFAVVGDVKQSIYGWRGGDSSLFKQGVDASMFPNRVAENSLLTNFRSHGRIVYFNNWLFSRLSDEMATQVLASDQVSDAKVFTNWDALYKGNYQDVKQLLKEKYGQKAEEGFVEMRVHRKAASQKAEESTEDTETEEAGFDWIIRDLIRLQAAGIKAEEIAILVRNNRDLAQMVQILDRAGRENQTEADFTFIAQSAEKMEDHLLIQFLALGLQSIIHTSDFQFVQLEKMASTLNLDTRFGVAEPGRIPEWRVEFRKTFGAFQMDLSSSLDQLVLFFGLDQFAEHQYGFTTFKNLILRYLQQESESYPDFTSWWINKASKLKLELPESSKGIQILTIHKAKGLDFGVVILAINSNPSSDSLLKFDFWPQGEKEPWGAYPLLKSKAQSSFGNSDLGAQFENQIYKQVLENLNLWYVALTRPRYGLIIDICLGAKENLEPPLGKSPTKLARLAFQVPFQLIENQEYLLTELKGSRLEIQNEVPEQLLHFQYGSLAKPVDQMETKEPVKFSVQQPIRNFPRQIPWIPVDLNNEDTLAGVYTHKVLEKCLSSDEWPMALAAIQPQNFKEQMASSVWQTVEKNLQLLFNNEKVKLWFSDKYVQMPEQEIVSKDGKVYRADRILKGEDGYCILDFKTGLPMESHENQVKGYMETLNQITATKVRAYLVYTSPLEIKEVV